MTIFLVCEHVLNHLLARNVARPKSTQETLKLHGGKQHGMVAPSLCARYAPPLKRICRFEYLRPSRANHQRPPAPLDLDNQIYATPCFTRLNQLTHFSRILRARRLTAVPSVDCPKN
jgi:hypothetical protein